MNMLPSKARRGVVRGAAIIVLLLILLAVPALSGCGDDPSITTTTTMAAEPTSTASTAGQNTTTTTTPGVTLSPYQTELARTANVQNALVRHLVEQDAAQDEPAMALVLGLRSRTLALSCRQALSEGDLDLARQAMLEVYSTLNRGRAIAEGTTVQVLTEGHAVIETLGSPADDPERAARLLEEYIAVLAPLVDEAEALTATP